MVKSLSILIAIIGAILNGCADSKHSESKAMYHPQDREELVHLLRDEHINLNQIDTSHITDMSYLFSRISQEQCEELFTPLFEAVDSFVILLINEIATENNSYIPEKSDFETIKSSLVKQWQEEKEKCAFNASSRQDFSGIESWNVANVEDMSHMFAGVKEFNENLRLWNVGNVKNMRGMFLKTAFNQNIESWDTASVQDMSVMFASSEFNQPLSTWNITRVKDMSFMFYESNFNQSLESWDISKVESMNFMFAKSLAFNQNLESWGKHLHPQAQTYMMFADSLLESTHTLPKWYRITNP